MHQIEKLSESWSDAVKFFLLTFVRRSTSVSGMVKVQSRMSEMARFAMKMFLVVSITLLVRKARMMAKLPITPKIITRL